RSDPDILQPRSLILQEGQAAHMRCEQRKGHNVMYWYRQKAGQAPELLFAFQSNLQMHKGNDLARFEAQQFETKNCNLNISDVKPEDSAVSDSVPLTETVLKSATSRRELHTATLCSTGFLACISLGTEAMRWEVLLGVSVGLQLLAGLCSGVTVVQRERFTILQVGANASIPCEQDDATYNTILWYRQKSSSTAREMQLIGYSVHGNDPTMEMDKIRFDIDRRDVHKAFLNIAAVQTADTAGYFCAASQGTVCALCLVAIHKHLCTSCPSVSASKSPQTNQQQPPPQEMHQQEEEEGKHSGC
ncbi:UNVERIFIED_CONTAM: hypothetical protein K2H54_024167, partial [Gekko kuhli]